MANKKHIKSENDKIFLNTFIRAQILSIVSFIFLFILVGIILLSADLTIGVYYPVALISVGIVSFVTAYFSGRIIRKNGLLLGFTFTLPLNILAILISLILSGFTADFNLVYTFLAIAAFGVLGGILAVNKRIKKKRGTK